MERLSLVSFADANWANNELKRKSMGGNFIFIGPSLVHDICHTQKTVATTWVAAELTEISYATKALQYMYQFYIELKAKPYYPVILTDSISSFNTLERPIQRKKNRIKIKKNAYTVPGRILCLIYH